MNGPVDLPAGALRPLEAGEPSAAETGLSSGPAPGLDDDQLAAQTWWRTERQTFIPVPAEARAARQAVFTILVQVTPLTQAFEATAQAARVHDALASMSDAVLAYRGLTVTRPALLRWLARRAAGDAA